MHHLKTFNLTFLFLFCLAISYAQDSITYTSNAINFQERNVTKARIFWDGTNLNLENEETRFSGQGFLRRGIGDIRINAIDRISLLTHDTIRMSILQRGNIGVGTIKPGALFHIKGNPNFFNESKNADELMRLDADYPTLSFYDGVTLKGYLQHTNTNNLYLTNTQNGNLYFGTGGSTRMTIDENGQVDMTGNLSLSGNTATIYFEQGNSFLSMIGSNLFLQNNTTGNGDIGISAADDLYLRTGGSTRLFLNENGQLGLGTLLPSAGLEINYNSSPGNPSLEITEADDDSGKIYFRNTMNPNPYAFIVSNPASSTPSMSFGLNDGSGSDRLLDLDFDDADPTIRANGKLNVDGDLRLQAPNNSSYTIRTENDGDLKFVGNGEIRMSIGDATGRTEIRANSAAGAGTLSLTETGNDFARLTFRSEAEDDNYWDIAGFTGVGNDVLNIFHNTTGNIVSINAVDRTMTVNNRLQVVGSDLAESFDVNTEKKVLPGYVLSIDTQMEGELTVSTTAHDRKVAGIVSGAGGIKTALQLGQEGTLADGDFPVAITGRVYCWVDANYGAIEAGDLLTTSNTFGHAMKVKNYEEAQGAIIGKAMTSLKEGKGLVLVLISMQ